MSEDPSSTNGPPRRSWFGRLSQALSGEPRNREDLLAELRQAGESGLIAADTLAMIEGAMEVADLQVADVMVPRAQMVSVPADATLDEILAVVIESGHSRFPVHGEDRDEILGILLAKDLLRCFRNGRADCDIHALLRPAVLIPESKRLNVLLREFRESHNHMAVVVNEYGGVAGLVTIEDVLEEIVGEIDDEHDDEAENIPTLIVPQSDGARFLVDALTPIDVFNEHFGSDFTDDEYDTVGGLVTSALGHMPEIGEETTLGRFHFRIARADTRRVHSLQVHVQGG
ncbi:MAG TPA: transporter associated domain-containing protein [Xanthomonadaceae bacterium]|nr:transporter associated domain-containing protein [Xanthomonadaceae bacterium]